MKKRRLHRHCNLTQPVSGRLSPIWKSATTCLVFAALPLVAGALTPTEWRHRQTVEIAAPGLVKVPVPAETFDGAQPGLADLRLVDANGQEIPYLMDRDLSSRGVPSPLEPAKAIHPKSFVSTLGDNTTQMLIETGTTDVLEAVDLESSLPFFLKAAHVEISADGQTWQSLGSALPVFRQFGAEQLRLPLNRHPAAFVRVTVDDFRSRQVVFTGARLLPAPARAAPPLLVPVGVRLTRRDEFAGETVLTLALDGSQVPLAELALEARDPLFMRRVTVAIREVRGEVSSERLVGSGTLYRIALDGAPAQSQPALPLDFSPPTRELLVHIHNGDSPPLVLDGVQARQHPVNLLFRAPTAGTYTLLSGNPQAAAPRYDLAAFAGELRLATATTVVPGQMEPVAGYHPRESLAEPPLPDVPLTGAPLETKDWPYLKAVQLLRPGVQELELDLEALARSRPDFADLRLLRAGNQIPYVLEQPALARSLTLQPVAVPNPKHPAVSLWRVALPQSNLPLRRVVLASKTPLFQRQFRLYEILPGQNGGTMENTLAAGPWSRTPEPGMPEKRIFELPDRMHTDTLWIETDNGDNPALGLDTVQAVHPVIRLVFKVAETDGFALAYGNKEAAAPRYDLSLVAVKLLTSSRNIAQPAAGAANPNASSGNRFAGLNSGAVFWGALALVVVVLLFVVAKLLPKPPALHPSHLASSAPKVMGSTVFRGLSGGSSSAGDFLPPAPCYSRADS